MTRPRPEEPAAVVGSGVAEGSVGSVVAEGSVGSVVAEGSVGSVVAEGSGPRLDVVVTGLSSDAHTWNLVYLELLLEELGCLVTNLGGCTPDERIVRECAARRPDLVVISSLNGHGCQDGTRLIGAFRACPGLVTTPVVIGGKLDVVDGGDGGNAARLLAAGFDAVFEDSAGLMRFRSFVRTLSARTAAPIGRV